MATRTLRDIERNFNQIDQRHAVVERQFSKFSRTRHREHSPPQSVSYVDELLAEGINRFGARRNGSSKSKNNNLKRHRFWESLEPVHVDDYQELVLQQDEILRELKAADGTITPNFTQVRSRRASLKYPGRPATSMSVTTVTSGSINEGNRKTIPESHYWNLQSSRGTTRSETASQNRNRDTTLNRLKEVINAQIKRDIGYDSWTVKEADEESNKCIFTTRFKIEEISDPHIWNFNVVFKDRETHDEIFWAINVDLDRTGKYLVVSPSEYVSPLDVQKMLAGKAFIAEVYKKEAFSMDDAFDQDPMGDLLKTYLVSFSTNGGHTFVSSQDHHFVPQARKPISVPGHIKHQTREEPSHYKHQLGYRNDSDIHYFGMLDHRVYDLPFSPFSDAFKYSYKRVSQSRSSRAMSLTLRVKKRVPHSSATKRSQYELKIPHARDLIDEWKFQQAEQEDTQDHRPLLDAYTKDIARLKVPMMSDRTSLRKMTPSESTIFSDTELTIELDEKEELGIEGKVYSEEDQLFVQDEDIEDPIEENENTEEQQSQSLDTFDGISMRVHHQHQQQQQVKESLSQDRDETTLEVDCDSENENGDSGISERLQELKKLRKRIREQMSSTSQ